jgi:two-component system, chemotaxis family, chemotaxis protein CheY
MPGTLLVVDDSLIIRKMITEAATEAGWEVSGEASNGQEAIDRYLELRPDAVTLDLIMPDTDGLHGLRGIIAKDPEAKVIVVSALGQKGVLQEAFRCGATDFLLKPIDKQMLAESLRQLPIHDASAAADPA